MAHMIEQFGDLAAFVAARTPGWHALGTVADKDDLTISEAMDTAYLSGWHVHKQPLMVPVGNTDDLRFIGVPGMSATVRTNPFDRSQYDALGVVSNSYKVEQVEDVAAFAQNVADEGLYVDAAGSLAGGKRYFFTFRLPSTITVPGTDDAIQTFLVIASSMDGSLATTGMVTPVRVVCQNTLDYTLGTAANQRFAYRHVGEGLEGKVAQARELIGVTFDAQDEFATVAAMWAEREVTGNEFDKIVAGLFPLDDDAPAQTVTKVHDARDTYRSLYTAAPTQANIRGTAWAALMAATEQQEWFGRTFKDPVKAAEFRMESPTLPAARRRATNLIAHTLALPKVAVGAAA